MEMVDERGGHLKVGEMEDSACFFFFLKKFVLIPLAKSENWERIPITKKIQRNFIMSDGPPPLTATMRKKKGRSSGSAASSTSVIFSLLAVFAFFAFVTPLPSLSSLSQSASYSHCHGG